MIQCLCNKKTIESNNMSYLLGMKHYCRMSCLQCICKLGCVRIMVIVANDIVVSNRGCDSFFSSGL